MIDACGGGIAIPKAQEANGSMPMHQNYTTDTQTCLNNTTRANINIQTVQSTQNKRRMMKQWYRSNAT